MATTAETLGYIRIELSFEGRSQTIWTPDGTASNLDLLAFKAKFRLRTAANNDITVRKVPAS